MKRFYVSNIFFQYVNRVAYIGILKAAVFKVVYILSKFAQVRLKRSIFTRRVGITERYHVRLIFFRRYNDY